MLAENVLNQPGSTLPPEPTDVRVQWQGRVRSWVGPHMLVLGVLIAVAILAPLLAPYDPVHANPSIQVQPPSPSHWFGTDIYGMDIFSRILWATRLDFSIALLGVLIGLGIGVLMGAVSGFVGGVVDDALSRLAEIAQSIPLFLFALMVFAALGNSRLVLFGIIGFANVPIFMKLVRSVVLPMRESDFIAASRAAGLPRWQIILRHVIPNSLAPVTSQASISCAYAIQIVAGLSFVGLGVPIPQPEWGSMIQEGAGRIIYGEWWPALFPGLAIVIAVVTFQGIGRRLARVYAAG
jgi:peptide/nickel transport system permease protein